MGVPAVYEPNAQHILDWFHIPMRVTVMGQEAKRLQSQFPTIATGTATIIERMRRFLWHENAARALDLAGDIDSMIDNGETHQSN